METLASLMCSGGWKATHRISFGKATLSPAAVTGPSAPRTAVRHTIKDIALKRSRRFFFLSVLTIGAALLATSSYAQKHRTEGTKEEIEENHIQQMQTWFEGYANPEHDANFALHRAEGIRQMNRLPNPMAMSATSGSAWIPVGMSQEEHVSGRGTSLAFGQNGELFLGTACGGLWKYDATSKSWSPMSDNWGSLNVGGVAVDPNNKSTIYAGTGVSQTVLQSQGLTSTTTGVGVYKSVDDGLNWTLLPGSPAQNGLGITQMEVNWGDSHFVYAATTTGVFVSTNDGTSWTRTLTTGNYTTIVIDPKNSSVVYAAGSGSIKKSRDKGLTWATVGSGYTSYSIMALAMSQASSDTVYLAVMGGNSGSEVVMSPDSGHTWITRATSANFLGQQGEYANAIAVKPSDRTTVVVGGLDIYAGLRNGASALAKRTNWTDGTGSQTFTHADIHLLKYSPEGVLYTLTDGGIFYSGNDGATWSSDLNKTLSTFMFVGGDMGLDGNGEPLYFAAGAQDNGINRLKIGETAYTSIRGGDGGNVFIGQDNNQVVYSTYVNATLYRSEDGGDNMNTSPNILPDAFVQGEGAPFYMEYEMSESNANMLAVCGGKNLWICPDASVDPAPFTQATNTGDLSAKVNYPVKTAHIAKADNNYIYVGAGTYVFYSTDMGVTWTKSKTPLNSAVVSITTAYDDPTHVYAVTTAGTRFWYSTDTGRTWTSPANNLPALNCYRVAVDVNGIIYVGNAGGVLRSGDTGKTWYKVAEGLPPTIVMSLRTRGHYLVASTWGRGMYYVDLNTLPPIPTSTSGSSVAPAVSPTGNIEISAVYPNPVSASNGTSNVRFSIKDDSRVMMSVFDVLGREERVLVNEWQSKGDHEVTANLGNIPAGQHYIVLTADGVTVTKPITIQ